MWIQTLGSVCQCTDVSCVFLQTEASCRVESHSDEECVRGRGGNLRARLRQGGQQGRRRHMGGAASLQTGVGRAKHQVFEQDKGVYFIISEYNIL